VPAGADHDLSALFAEPEATDRSPRRLPRWCTGDRTVRRALHGLPVESSPWNGWPDCPPGRIAAACRDPGGQQAEASSGRPSKACAPG